MQAMSTLSYVVWVLQKLRIDLLHAFVFGHAWNNHKLMQIISVHLKYNAVHAYIVSSEI